MKIWNFVLGIFVIVSAIPAFAKVTVFSSQDALASLLASKRFQELVTGDVKSVSIKRTGDIYTSTFTFDIDYNLKQTNSATDCSIIVKIKSELIEPVPCILTSRLSSPVFGLPNCHSHPI